MAGLVFLSTTACTDRNEPTSAVDAGEGTVAFALKGMPPQAVPGETSDVLSEVSVFHFKGDDFLLRTDVKDPYAESIELPFNGTTRDYCVAGIALTAEEGSKEADFLNTTVSCEANANSSPIFYTGSIDFSDENLANGRLEIEIKRGVARIDFSNTVDPNIIINKVIVEDAPATSFVIPQNSIAEGSTISFTREFSEPFQGVEEGIFTLFESGAPVHVRILGEYGDTPVNIRTILPTVERNKVYTLQVTNINSNVAGAFTCKDWEEGKTTGAVPSAVNIMLDKTNTNAPEGVEVNYGTNTVTIPYEGVKNMKLAFVAKTKVSISSIEGEISTAKVTANEPVKHVKFTQEKAYNTDNGVITKFNVDINPQLKGRPDYEMKMYVKKTVMNTSYDYVTIRVAQSDYQISTVELAGVKWMAFNATSPDPDDQVYVEKGKTAEDMYADDWVTCVGGLFQFGRKYKYIPYQSYNPCNDLGNQKQDIPWVHESHMPLPEGYHAATIDEWLALIPAETTIEHGTSYTAGNGETINVEVIRLPGDVVTPTNVNGVCRYLKLTSAETGNSLILPYGGYKGDKSTALSSNFGKDMVYWGNDNNNCPGGHARAIRFMFNWGNRCVPNVFQWPMEAFAYVRGVKND